MHKEVYQMTIPELITQYEKDIQFDAHGVSLRVLRSRARIEIIKRGKPVLRVIANHLRNRFQVGKEVDQDLKKAWIDLLWGDMITDPPYDSRFPYSEQEMGVWESACLKEYGPPLKTKEDLRFERVIAAIRNPDFGVRKLRRVLEIYMNLPTGEFTPERANRIYEQMEKHHPD